MIGAPYPSMVRLGPTVDYLERAFDAAKYGGFAERPYLAIMVPSMADPTVAPPGKHVVSIFGGHAAYKLHGEDWTDETSEALYKTVLDTISEYAPGFGHSVIGKIGRANV